VFLWELPERKFICCPCLDARGDASWGALRTVKQDALPKKAAALLNKVKSERRPVILHARINTNIPCLLSKTCLLSNTVCVALGPDTI
jgi:hypothetical protein